MASKVALSEGQFDRVGKAIRKIERLELPDNQGVYAGSIQIATIEITSAAPTTDVNGETTGDKIYYDAKFIFRTPGVDTWYEPEAKEGKECRAKGLNDGEILEQGEKYVGIMWDDAGSYPVVITIAGAGGDKVEVGSPRNSGVTPPHAKLMDWGIDVLSLVNLEFSDGDLVWVRNANAP
jgi:hypothetical protein